ncbi:glycogen synthase kinase-3 alpha [Anaeramoeba ignava]|uniref:Glycogen synthase kinase-3 alpha n=1 Tax=Anaeramoeba ignava TaxID=1746090 RepID=A0A9Q0R8R5_ANAIG|nr:glycogen synthase kinase-3 alpha [Anaeramoeba ignava]
MTFPNRSTQKVYRALSAAGKGTFGTVYKAMIINTQEIVAIKKVLQDPKYKNRELSITKILDHINVVRLKDSFYTTESEKVYLHLVLDYIPETVSHFSKTFKKNQKAIPLLWIKVFMFQLLRAINYLHQIGVCHRDIKPQNLLIDPSTGILKICDFGSAKILIQGEPNIAYICSRHYRAPELILGESNYTTDIDLWSCGCIFAELFIGKPIFPGENRSTQFLEIIRVLGTPTDLEFKQMNSSSTTSITQFPHFEPKNLSSIFPDSTPPEAIDLISNLLKYSPSDRIRPLEACTHPFFSELRNKNLVLPSGMPLPPLFDFSEQELSGIPQNVVDLLVPQKSIPSNNFFFLSRKNEEQSKNSTNNEKDIRANSFQSSERSPPQQQTNPVIQTNNISIRISNQEKSKKKKKRRFFSFFRRKKSSNVN